MKLTLLSATLLVVGGCNEKVSPELQDAASSSTVPDVTPPSTYYFKVENGSSTALNYKLHRTGNGYYNTACSISKTVPLSNSLYQSSILDDADSSDLSCYFDVDELALYYSGLSFNVSASSNTCEYIGYSPFSYYNRMPGDSSTSLYEIVCDATTVNPAAILATTDGAPAATEIALPAGALTTSHAVNYPVVCGSYIDRSIATAGASASRAPFTITSDADLCRFNYTDGDAEQCDEGIINITTVGVTYDSNTATYSSTSSNRQVKCGGKAYNCIRGPIKLLDTKSTTFNLLSATTTNTAFSTTYTLPPLIANRFPGNWEYTNFRRNLASVNIDYLDSFGYDPGDYIRAFAGYEDFNPSLMDRYTNNRMMNADPIIATGVYNTAGSYSYYTYQRDAAGNLLYKRRPLAAEPFMGLTNPDNGRSYRTNPFYSFYCLDGAYDIKSRIRIMIRDWDRVFPDTASLELISDIDLSTNTKQDILATEEEIPWDGDSINWYNDFYDWDDILQMERTTGAFDADATIWRPSTSENPVTYPEGFFDPSIFPQVDME